MNNAAHQGKSVKDLSELDPSRVEPTFRVNVFALFETVRQAVPHMKPGSVIINTASIQGFDPKAADAALAHELAAMGLL